MSKFEPSYLKVQYDLRPAKQVERRIFIESFNLLTEAGFSIRDYHYTGMGSIHFVDFAMFHKFLGLSNLSSVEISSEINERLKFNTPYSNCVEVFAGRSIGEHIPHLSTKEKHVLWLDYDNIISSDILRDITQAITLLSNDSILIITVDTEPPEPNANVQSNKASDEAENTQMYFEELVDGYASYFITKWKEEDFEYDNLPGLNLQLIQKAISEGLKGRFKGLFIPLYHFLYADGHRMLTVGGMIGTKKTERILLKSRLSKMNYTKMNFNTPPFLIRIPKLTRKERLYLDSNMPLKNGWRPKDFELSQTDLSDYDKIYRFIPSYAELLF